MMIHDLIADIVRKEMQTGGIVVHIFRDTNVNLRQGKLFVFKYDRLPFRVLINSRCYSIIVRLHNPSICRHLLFNMAFARGCTKGGIDTFCYNRYLHVYNTEMLFFRHTNLENSWIINHYSK